MCSDVIHRNTSVGKDKSRWKHTTRSRGHGSPLTPASPLRFIAPMNHLSSTMPPPSATTSGLRMGGLGGCELSHETRWDDSIVLIFDNPKSRRLPKVQLTRGVGMKEEDRIHLHWSEVPGTSNRRGAAHLNRRYDGCRRGRGRSHDHSGGLGWQE